MNVEQEEQLRRTQEIEKKVNERLKEKKEFRKISDYWVGEWETAIEAKKAVNDWNDIVAVKNRSVSSSLDEKGYKFADKCKKLGQSIRTANRDCDDMEDILMDDKTKIEDKIGDIAEKFTALQESFERNREEMIAFAKSYKDPTLKSRKQEQLRLIEEKKMKDQEKRDKKKIRDEINEEMEKQDLANKLGTLKKNLLVIQEQNEKEENYLKKKKGLK